MTISFSIKPNYISDREKGVIKVVNAHCRHVSEVPQPALKGGSAKYVSSGNIIPLTMHFPIEKCRKSFLGRESGNLLDSSRWERVWLRGAMCRHRKVLQVRL